MLVARAGRQVHYEVILVCYVILIRIQRVKDSLPEPIKVKTLGKMAF